MPKLPVLAGIDQSVLVQMCVGSWIAPSEARHVTSGAGGHGMFVLLSRRVPIVMVPPVAGRRQSEVIRH